MASYSVGQFLEDDEIVLEDIPSDTHPEGKAYRFPSPPFEVGLWLKNLIEFGQRAQLGVPVGKDDLAKLVLEDDDETDLYRRVMGTAFDEMRADGVSWGRVQRIFPLLLKHWGNNTSIADAMAEANAGNPPARANRATRRSAAKKPAKKAPARASLRKGGSNSSPASSGTRARTAARASTRSSATSDKKRTAAARA